MILEVEGMGDLVDLDFDFCFCLGAVEGEVLASRFVRKRRRTYSWSVAM